MTEILEKSLINGNMKDNSYYEISLSDIFFTLLRSKKIIIFSSIIGILASFFVVKTTPKTFEGQFQIVLEKESNDMQTRNDLSQLMMSNFNGAGSDNLNTKIKILESPSVLKPIYEYLVEQKKVIESKNIPNKYEAWAPNLNIDLLKGTSVLNVKYRDTDKELIFNVLNKISEAYQEFSFKKVKNKQKNLIEWLDNQYEQMIVKSNASLDKLQKFSLKYGLGNPDGLPNAKPIVQGVITGNSQGTGGLQDTQNTNDFNETRQRYNGQFQKLYMLEQSLMDKSLYLKDNSLIIKNLKNRIERLRDSLSRPQEVLLEYRILQRDAKRDESILTSLENNILAYKLEVAKKSDPWELISKPTISDKPVKPIPQNIFLSGTIIGFLIGVLISLFIANKKGILYSLNELNRIINYQYLLTLPINDIKECKKIMKIFVNNFFDKKNIKDISQVLLIQDEKGSKEERIYSDLFINEGFKVIKDKTLIDNSKDLLLCFVSGKISKNEVIKIIELIEISRVNVRGWIYLG